MDKITIDAYAKINIYLDVTGKRTDGYHNIETVMHTVSLFDTVTVEKKDSGIEIRCNRDSIPCDERNIAYKCAELFFKENKISGGAVITIEKNIPEQAGMGGGSADGAAVLKCLNTLYETDMTSDMLCELGKKIGADIPFCIKGGCGWCTGVGEEILLLPRLDGYLLIAKGNEGISTKDAYSAVDTLGKPIGMKNVKDIFLSVPTYETIAPFCRNIFEDAADIPDVGIIKKTMLDMGAAAACMTGSGSAVFGLFDDLSAMSECCDNLKGRGYFSEICRFV